MKEHGGGYVNLYLRCKAFSLIPTSILTWEAVSLAEGSNSIAERSIDPSLPLTLVLNLFNNIAHH